MNYSAWMDLPVAVRERVNREITRTISACHASPGWLMHYRDRFMVYLSKGSQDVERALAMTLALVEEEKADLTPGQISRESNQNLNNYRPEQKAQQQNLINAAITACILDSMPVPVELRPAINRCADCHKPLRDVASITLGLGTDCLLKNAISLGVEDPVKTVSALKELALKLRYSA